MTAFSTFVFFAVVSTTMAFEKSYVINGNVLCHGEPEKDASIDLKYFDKVHKGEVLVTAKTDEEGKFTIKASGDTSHFVDNDFKVYLEITSSCDRLKREGCSVLTAIRIPPSSEGKDYSIESIRLEKRPPVLNTCDEADDGY